MPEAWEVTTLNVPKGVVADNFLLLALLRTDYHCSTQGNKEVPFMARKYPLASAAPFFSVAQAKWVIGVLGMLIAVVGKDSLLGLILRQTRYEINSLIQDEGPSSAVERAVRYKDN
jgi:hypothetical protein